MRMKMRIILHFYDESSPLKHCATKMALLYVDQLFNKVTLRPLSDTGGIAWTQGHLLILNDLLNVCILNRCSIYWGEKNTDILDKKLQNHQEVKTFLSSHTDIYRYIYILYIWICFITDIILTGYLFPIQMTLLLNQVLVLNWSELFSGGKIGMIWAAVGLRTHTVKVRCGTTWWHSYH